jgi:hypothetical protein
MPDVVELSGIDHGRRVRVSESDCATPDGAAYVFLWTSTVGLHYPYTPPPL